MLVIGLDLQFNRKEDTEEVLPAWDTFIRDLQLEAKLQGLLFPYM